MNDIYMGIFEALIDAGLSISARRHGNLTQNPRLAPNLLIP